MSYGALARLYGFISVHMRCQMNLILCVIEITVVAVKLLLNLVETYYNTMDRILCAFIYGDYYRAFNLAGVKTSVSIQISFLDSHKVSKSKKFLPL